MNLISIVDRIIQNHGSDKSNNIKKRQINLFFIYLHQILNQTLFQNQILIQIHQNQMIQFLLNQMKKFQKMTQTHPIIDQKYGISYWKSKKIQDQLISHLLIAINMLQIPTISVPISNITLKKLKMSCQSQSFSDMQVLCGYMVPKSGLISMLWTRYSSAPEIFKMKAKSQNSTTNALRPFTPELRT